ncbi:MAG: DUF4926 domain-containing protein [Chloroflexi bacterium]|nr:DUF4926 domain-containing protein [Chloroflexota bacterium]
MIKELDVVALTVDLPDHGLEKGAIGTVVWVYPNQACEVEFLDVQGYTVALVILTFAQVRPLSASEVAAKR